MHYFILIVLAPLFILQGKRVKRSAPRLAEAQGERAGQSGQGKPFSLLVFGDSAAAGVGVEHQSKALLGVVSQSLAELYQVNWRLLARSGYNTEKELRMLQKELLAAPKLQLDAVVVSLGVNDVLSPLSAKTWIKQQRMLVELLTQQTGCQRLIITRVPPMGDFPLLPQPLRWFLGKRSQEFNRHLARYVASEPRCTLLDFGEQLDSKAMASDGFHPGAVIYQDWGKAAAKAILQHKQV